MTKSRLDMRALASRLTIELGPVFLFFAVVRWQGIFAGTAAFMAAVALAVVVSWWQERRLPIVPLTSLGFALLFGGITLASRDPIWILLRPTVYNAGAAAVLAGALWRRWLILKSVFGRGLRLTDGAWLTLTWRTVAFFAFLAALNEIVWRLYGIEVWAGFKAFAVPALNLAFLAVNWRFVSREQLGRPAALAATARA